MKFYKIIIFNGLILACALITLLLGKASEEQAFRNLVYASPGGKDLSLNLFVPQTAGEKMPVILWIHGGAWYAGGKNECPVLPLTKEGYAVASIDYRLSPEAAFPAQIEDCKAAVRWLRVNAARYHLDPERIGAGGFSAGGHLAALLGTSGGVPDLEGSEGNAEISSRVQAVVDGFGPSDFIGMDRDLAQRGVPAPGPPPYAVGTWKPREALACLLGGPLETHLDLAKKASPLTYVSANNPPFLILHGGSDKTVPVSQSEMLAEALKKAGVPVELEIVPNAGHGNNPAYLNFMRTFFAKYLKSTPQESASMSPDGQIPSIGSASVPTAPAIPPDPALPKSDKSTPAGIFVLTPEDRPDKPAIDFSKLPPNANPAGDGLALRTFWNKVEPSEGQRDWKHFDDGIAWAKRKGKTASLSMAAGIWSPSWLYEAHASAFNVSLVNPMGEAVTKTMPLPWDPVFQEKWRATLMDFGRRYDSDPAVSYVVIGGVGFVIESYFAKTPDNIQQFQSLGGLEKWLEGSKKVVDMYAEAFPHTPFVLAMGQPTPTPEGMDALMKLVDYGMQKYPGHFGIAHHGLDARSNASFPPFAAIERYASVSPVGFQMVWSTQGRNAGMIHGTLGEALDRGIELKGHFVEVYVEDCRNPAYADLLRASSEKLHANAAALK